jgi:hypothetical protein
MCEAVLLCYFVSMWKFRIWLLGTAAAVAVTIFLAVLGTLHLRGLTRDLFPIALYFGYLMVAASQSAYPSEARFWAGVDSGGALVAGLFWIAGRNSSPAAIRRSFARLCWAAAAVAVALHRTMPHFTRLAGYGMTVVPVSLPFLWADIVGRSRRRTFVLATIGLALILAILSRSRTPLAAALLALALAVFWIGRSLLTKVKFALLLAVLVVGSVAFLYSFTTTRTFMLIFVSRITGDDVIVGDIYIRGEPKDIVRVRLGELAAQTVWEAQPFGVGYATFGRIYERHWGDFTTLHSMYQAWLIEGGIVCVLIVLAIGIRQFRALRTAGRLAPTEDEAVMARCLMIATFIALLMGMFHQMHQTPTFFAILGLGLGFRRRVIARRRDLERTHAT